MTESRPLLMIPGPVEISEGVRRLLSQPPPSHQAPALIEAFGKSLGLMREVWQAGTGSHAFVVAGGGTLAMEMAVANLVDRGDEVLVVNTGYFADRMSEMLRRAGATVQTVGAPVGEAPSAEEVAEALRSHPGTRVLFATHVDTSTGVRIDPEPLAALCRKHDVLSVFDGVCATGGERFAMEAWDADVYFTASQKALGLPAGLALMVVHERALARRERRKDDPPMYLDWSQWLPIMKAYQEGRPSYFSTPATSMILALAQGLSEIVDRGIEIQIERHGLVAESMDRAWRRLGLESVPRAPGGRAHTLSALYLPNEIEGASFPAQVSKQGVIVAGGLHPEIKGRYFRVGHMGSSVWEPEYLSRTVGAVGRALQACGRSVDVEAAVREVASLA